jgi:hypothetical protein
MPFPSPTFASAASHPGPVAFLALSPTEGAADVHRVLLKHAPNQGRGRPKNGQANNASREAFSRGHSRSLAKPILAARLAQEHPTFYDAYLHGEYRTIHAAGIVKVPTRLVVY